MTKAQYIGKYPIVADKSGNNLYVSRGDAMKVMDEYAIAFGEFLEKKTIGERQRYSVQELHNQFIEQQNKP